MTDKLKVVKTREHSRLPGLGRAAPGYNGPPALLITGIRQEAYDLTGQEVKYLGERMTVLGPCLLHDGSDEIVVVENARGHRWAVASRDLSPAPQTQTVTLEIEDGDRAVPLSVVERALKQWEALPPSWVSGFIRDLTDAIDGEEVGDD